MNGPHRLPHCRHRQHVPATTAIATQTQPHVLTLSRKTQHRQGGVAVTEFSDWICATPAFANPQAPQALSSISSKHMCMRCVAAQKKARGSFSWITVWFRPSWGTTPRLR